MVDKMDGTFLGGGALDYVFNEGEVYLHSEQLAFLFGNAGIIGGRLAVEANDEFGGAQALLMMALARQVHALRSELLKQEVEKSFNLPDAE
jgi:hypothetical protein